MGFQKFMKRVVGILQVHQLPCAGGAVLAARGVQSLSDAVIAQSALLHGLFLWVDEAATVGTRLHAIPAAEAIFFVDQYYTIRSIEGSAYRANLHTRRVHAVI